MDIKINSKTIGKKGWGVYESYVMTSPDSAKTRVRKLLGAFDDEHEALWFMRDKAENRYDDPLEYDRTLIYKGKGIRFEHHDWSADGQVDDSYDLYIKEVLIFD